MTTSSFALVRLYEAVIERFRDEGSGPESPADVAQSFGWREEPRSLFSPLACPRSLCARAQPQ